MSCAGRPLLKKTSTYEWNCCKILEAKFWLICVKPWNKFTGGFPVWMNVRHTDSSMQQLRKSYSTRLLFQLWLRGQLAASGMRRQQRLGKNRWHLEKLGAGLEEVFSCRLRETRERGSLQKGVLQECVCEKSHQQAKIQAAQRNGKKQYQIRPSNQQASAAKGIPELGSYSHLTRVIRLALMWKWNKL